jgi:hypothetical protein
MRVLARGWTHVVLVLGPDLVHGQSSRTFARYFIVSAVPPRRQGHTAHRGRVKGLAAGATRDLIPSRSGRNRGRLTVYVTVVRLRAGLAAPPPVPGGLLRTPPVRTQPLHEVVRANVETPPEAGRLLSSLFSALQDIAQSAFPANRWFPARDRSGRDTPDGAQRSQVQVLPPLRREVPARGGFRIPEAASRLSGERG